MISQTQTQAAGLDTALKFDWAMPTRVIAGQDCVRANAPLLAGLGSRAFIMTGPSSAAKNGSLDDMLAALESQNIPWVHHAKVKPNPSLQDVRAAADEARQAKADLIIAIGGGSPMDAAKAVAVLAVSPVTDQELLGQRQFARVLPLVAVPTTAGTGSEVTPYSILTNDQLKTKSFLNSPQVFPRLAFLDGRYTLDLPRHISAATGVDALSHAVESYLAVRSQPLSRSLALEALGLMGPVLRRLAVGQRLGLGDREQLLYASTLGGMVIAQTGTTAVHAMGYSLTYFKDIDHGVANGVLLPAYLAWVATARPDAVASILYALGLPTLDRLEQLLADLTGRVELSAQEIETFAAKAITAGNIANTNPRPSLEDLKAMLGSCRRHQD